MRVALLSSTSFGYACLADGLLHTPGVTVAGVLTTPAKIDISYSDGPLTISTHARFQALGAEFGFQVHELTGEMTASRQLQSLEHWQPDLLLALGWYYVVPRRVRESARLGTLGIHASLLPKYRGGAPIPWAIINGETETGASLFYLEESVDTGDIVAQERFSIRESDTCATVYEKAASASVKILREYLPRLASGRAPRIPQDEGEATYYPQRRPEDGLIDWSWSPKRIRDFIRAQTKPYPGAYTYVGGKKVLIWDADIFEASD